MHMIQNYSAGDNCEALQKELGNRASKWLRRFSISKCKVMHLVAKKS